PALKVILVDDHAHTATATVFKTSHYTSATIELHVCGRAHHVGGQRDREVDHGTDRHVGVDLKHHTVGRDVFRLGAARSGLRTHRDRKLDRKARRTLNVVVARAVLGPVTHRLLTPEF